MKSTKKTLKEGGANLLKSLLLPGANIDKLTFKVYSGRKLANAYQGETVEPSDIIILQVNPQQIDHAKKKIVTKIQTNAPNRFVVFDWGSDLMALTITGSTGNLLPDVVSKKEQPLYSAIDSILPNDDPYPLEDFDNAMKKNIVGSVPYFDLLEMSPKYQAFKHLNDLYDHFDADQDVLVLEMGDRCYRGFFQDFTFAHTADSPWNWRYTIVFICLVDFLVTDVRGDSDTPNSSYIR